MATMAMGRLNSIQMQYNSPGSIPVFLTKFRDAIQDLKDANNPISDVMAKSLLLYKAGDSGVRGIGGPVVEPGQRGGHGQHLDVTQDHGGDGRIGEPGPGQRVLSP